MEADAVGGVLGPRYDIPTQPGVATLLSSARRGSFGHDFTVDSAGSLLRGPTETEAAVWAVPGPLSPEESLGSWMTVAATAARAMSADDRLWIVDCGRPWPNSPLRSLLAASILSIVVVDSSLASLVALRNAAPTIGGQIGAIIVGPADHDRDELLTFTGVDMFWSVPWVDDLAKHVGEMSTSRRARRSPLWRRALEIGHTLAQTTAAWHQQPNVEVHPGTKTVAEPNLLTLDNPEPIANPSPEPTPSPETIPDLSGNGANTYPGHLPNQTPGTNGASGGTDLGGTT